ncbi:uncharacterized protein [Salminus brasiliensis]|uniref:uncharacterized protein n=1 Tax=Salminus brasiliensis TaxID=930266 RepID=UPI003B831A53
MATAPALCMTTSRNREMKEVTIEEVKMALENLGPYNACLNANGEIVLRFIRQLPEIYQILSKLVHVAKGAVLCVNLIRYFYKQLTQNLDESGIELGDGGLHIVLVGDGSISDQVRPANWLVPLDTISDTVLYPPWNCSIDAKVAYGISTGGIQPEHRAFSQEIEVEHLPDQWNFMRAEQTHPVPEIILGPMTAKADWSTQLMALADSFAVLRRRKRFIIPYPPGGADWLPKEPLDEIIAVIAVLLMVLPPYKATIHLAAGLKYRGPASPDMETLMEQYAYTPDGTMMTTQNLQFTEYPMLYSVLRSMFN